ncbi:hypothetical protein HDU96_006892 [Phlyctochytrium bullatum]|nr:hypothetical protein HDU96_006892 [Phlyctochytrium bullatum]
MAAARPSGALTLGDLDPRRNVHPLPTFPTMDEALLRLPMQPPGLNLHANADSSLSAAARGRLRTQLLGHHNSEFIAGLGVRSIGHWARILQATWDGADDGIDYRTNRRNRTFQAALHGAMEQQRGRREEAERRALNMPLREAEVPRLLRRLSEARHDPSVAGLLLGRLYAVSRLVKHLQDLVEKRLAKVRRLKAPRRYISADAWKATYRNARGWPAPAIDCVRTRRMVSRPNADVSNHRVAAMDPGVWDDDTRRTAEGVAFVKWEFTLPDWWVITDPVAVDLDDSEFPNGPDVVVIISLERRLTYKVIRLAPAPDPVEVIPQLRSLSIRADQLHQIIRQQVLAQSPSPPPPIAATLHRPVPPAPAALPAASRRSSLTATAKTTPRSREPSQHPSSPARRHAGPRRWWEDDGEEEEEELPLQGGRGAARRSVGEEQGQPVRSASGKDAFYQFLRGEAQVGDRGGAPRDEREDDEDPAWVLSTTQAGVDPLDTSAAVDATIVKIETVDFAAVNRMAGDFWYEDAEGTTWVLDEQDEDRLMKPPTEELARIAIGRKTLPATVGGGKEQDNGGDGVGHPTHGGKSLERPVITRDVSDDDDDDEDDEDDDEDDHDEVLAVGAGTAGWWPGRGKGRPCTEHGWVDEVADMDADDDAEDSPTGTKRPCEFELPPAQRPKPAPTPALPSEGGPALDHRSPAVSSELEEGEILEEFVEFTEGGPFPPNSSPQSPTPLPPKDKGKERALDSGPTAHNRRAPSPTPSHNSSSAAPDYSQYLRLPERNPRVGRKNTDIADLAGVAATAAAPATGGSNAHFDSPLSVAGVAGVAATAATPATAPAPGGSKSHFDSPLSVVGHPPTTPACARTRFSALASIDLGRPLTVTGHLLTATARSRTWLLEAAITTVAQAASPPRLEVVMPDIDIHVQQDPWVHPERRQRLSSEATSQRSTSVAIDAPPAPSAARLPRTVRRGSYEPHENAPPLGQRERPMRTTDLQQSFADEAGAQRKPSTPLRSSLTAPPVDQDQRQRPPRDIPVSSSAPTPQRDPRLHPDRWAQINPAVSPDGAQSEEAVHPWHPPTRLRTNLTIVSRVGVQSEEVAHPWHPPSRIQLNHTTPPFDQDRRQRRRVSIPIRSTASTPQRDPRLHPDRRALINAASSPDAPPAPRSATSSSSLRSRSPASQPTTHPIYTLQSPPAVPDVWPPMPPLDEFTRRYMYSEMRAASRTRAIGGGTGGFGDASGAMTFGGTGISVRPTVTSPQGGWPTVMVSPPAGWPNVTASTQPSFFEIPDVMSTELFGMPDPVAPAMVGGSVPVAATTEAHVSWPPLVPTLFENEMEMPTPATGFGGGMDEWEEEA